MIFNTATPSAGGCSQWTDISSAGWNMSAPDYNGGLNAITDGTLVCLSVILQNFDIASMYPFVITPPVGYKPYWSASTVLIDEDNGENVGYIWASTGNKTINVFVTNGEVIDQQSDSLTFTIMYPIS